MHKNIINYIVTHYKEITGYEINEISELIKKFKENKIDMSYQELGDKMTTELDNLKQFVKDYGKQHNTTINFHKFLKELDKKIGD